MFIFFIGLILLFLPPLVNAAVFINEICWMGDKDSYRNEWVELYNSSTSPISLSAWKLMEKNLDGKIPPQGFLLFKIILNNKGEHLKLIDDQGILIDELDCSSGWPFGDNKTKQTMEKRDTFDGWQSSRNPGGTPLAENSSSNDTVIPSPEKDSGLADITDSFKQEDGAKTKQNFPANKKNHFPFSAALSVAAFSGITIFLLKKESDAL